MEEERRPERPRDEKEEKEEKGGSGESWDEKWRRDPVEAAVWAFVLIWVGLAWLLSNTGFWDNLLGRGAEWWPWAFIGAGLMLFMKKFQRSTYPGMPSAKN